VEKYHNPMAARESVSPKTI